MLLSRIFRISLIFLAIAAILLWAGCSDDAGNVTQPGEPARISGRVVSNPSPGSLAKIAVPVEGAVVSVARLEADGSLKTVSKESVKTNAGGEYVVEADVSGESGLFVIAEKDSLQWMAVVSASAEAGQTTPCQPHTDESTTEAEVARKDIAEDQKEDVSYVDIAAQVDAEVAGAVKNDAAATAALSAALKWEAEAEAQALAHSEIGATPAQVNAANQTRMRAQQQLEVSLNQAGENQTLLDAASETYYQALVDAYVDAGVSAGAYAKAKEIAARALVKNSATLNAQARLAVKKAAAYLRAWAIDRGCRSGFTAAGAAQAQIDAVANAGANLRIGIRNAATEADVIAAFENYHDAVIEQLRISLSARASVITNIDLAINGIAGTKATLATAIAAAASTDALIDAYAAFYSAVRTLVSTMTATATQAEINAITEILILTNMHI